MISVCMATYNGEKYIVQQIDSILTQLKKEDELIISDDGSTDNTIKVIQNTYKDQRIRIVSNEGNHGYTPNFYNALKYAKGDYIFLSDQDDIWMPNKVEVVVNYLKSYDFVHTDAMIVDADLNLINESHNNYYGSKDGFINNLLRSRYLGCCMAFNRKVLNSLFPVPCYSNNYPHDLWVALIAEFYYKAKQIDEPLLMYRRHDKNASDGGNSNDKGIVQIIKKTAYRFYYLYFILRQFSKVRNVRGVENE